MTKKAFQSEAEILEWIKNQGSIEDGMLLGDNLSMTAILTALSRDIVVILTSNFKRRELYDFMEDNKLDPSDYRVEGNAIWAA